MKILLIMRGLHGSGKSTFIEDNNLGYYTVSYDSLKSLLGGEYLLPNGDWGLDYSNKSYVELLQNILGVRFSKGVFTVLDGVNLYESDILKLVNIAKQYKYTSYCIDLTESVSVSECIDRDAKRYPPKRVGRDVILRDAKEVAPLKNQFLGLTVISPSDWKKVRLQPVDLSKYNRVNHIGDIHACYAALKEYMKDGIKPDEFYIFLGDYIDRGTENLKVLKQIDEWGKLPNVVLLEGNHEINLRCALRGDYTLQTVDFPDTLKEFKQLDMYLPLFQSVVKKLKDCFFYKYDDKLVLCNHGGISHMPSNLMWISSEQFIKGVGKYKDMIEVDKSFETSVKGKEVYQIHGHRNVEQVPIKVNSRCFNLNSNIEYGGNLRGLYLDKMGWHEKEVANPTYKNTKVQVLTDLDKILKYAYSHPQLLEVKDYGWYKGIRVTREALRVDAWSKMPYDISSMYINSAETTILVRGDKQAFGVNTRPEYNKDCLYNRVQYPLWGYVMQDGYTGMVGYDKETDRLLFVTTNAGKGSYCDFFRELLLRKVSEQTLKKFFLKYNVTLEFDVVNCRNSRAIIKYNEDFVELRGVIWNTMKGERVIQCGIVDIGKNLGLPVRYEYVTCDCRNELAKVVEEIENGKILVNNRHIKGVFFENTQYSFYVLSKFYRLNS